MQYQLHDIIPINKDNQQYFVSLVQKENQSGILYNQRLFFLHSTKCIGYMTLGKQKLQTINFNHPKTTILITNIKSIDIEDAILTISFFLINGDKKSQKKWLLKFKYEEIARKWYSKLQKEIEGLLIKQQRDQIALTQSKVPVQNKNNEQSRLYRTTYKPKKHLQFCKTIQYAIKNNIKQQPASKNSQISNNSSSLKQKLNAQQQLKKIINHKQDHKEVQNSIHSVINNKDQINKSIDDSRYNSSVSNYNNTPAAALKSGYQSVQFPQAITTIKQKQSNQSIKKVKSPSYTNPNKSQYLHRLQKLIKQSQILQQNKLKPKQSDNFQDKLIDNEIGEQQLTIKNINSISNIPYTTIQPPQQNIKYLPWTFRYIQNKSTTIHNFQQYTNQLMIDILTNLHQSQSPNKIQPQLNKKYKPKLIKDNIYYYDINDIQIKLSFIEQQIIGMNRDVQEQICRKQSNHCLQRQYKNYQLLDHYLTPLNKIKIPLISLCNYLGYKALFKVKSNFKKKYIKYVDLKSQLQLLQKSNIIKNWNENLNQIIIQLDQKYYQQFKNNNNNNIDKNLNFNLYIIQEIFNNNNIFNKIKDRRYFNKQYDQRQQTYSLSYIVEKECFRKELMFMMNQQSQEKEKWKWKGIRSDQQSSSMLNYDHNNQQERSGILKYLMGSLSTVIQEMDELAVWFMNSEELSDYLHQKGINIRCIGYIYGQLKNIFQRKFIMAQIAARSAKLMFRQMVQMLNRKQGKASFSQMKDQICLWLNCILGNTYQTVQIWRKLSLHAKHYYGVSINLTQLDKKIFMIALIHNCKLKINYNLIIMQKIFQTNTIFTKQNLLSLQNINKKISPLLQLQIKIKNLLSTYSHMNYTQLLSIYTNKKEQIVLYLHKSIIQKIKVYLAYYINPLHQLKNQQPYKFLQIYSLNFKPLKTYFQIIIIQLKWLLKSQQPQKCNKIYTTFIQQVVQFYGQAHPLYFQMYDLLATYYYNALQYQKAILYAKNSLLNSLKICGTYHLKSSEYYYYIANCFINIDNIKQAIHNINISKDILKRHQQNDDIPYATMCIKLGLLYLNQNSVDQCQQEINDALVIIQSKFVDQPQQLQDMYVECLQILSRLYEMSQSTFEKLKDLSLQCCIKLKHIHQPINLQKILKIYLQVILRQLTSQHASSYLDIITLLSIDFTDQTYKLAFQNIVKRIQQETFVQNIGLYMKKVKQIENHIQSLHLQVDWVNFSNIYQRKTIKDFINLTIQLVCFLGQGFMTGCLRECL